MTSRRPRPFRVLTHAGALAFVACSSPQSQPGDSLVGTYSETSLITITSQNNIVIMMDPQYAPLTITRGHSGMLVLNDGSCIYPAEAVDPSMPNTLTFIPEPICERLIQPGVYANLILRMGTLTLNGTVLTGTLQGTFSVSGTPDAMIPGDAGMGNSLNGTWSFAVDATLQ